MSSSRSLWSAPLPLVLLAALVAVLALLLGGSPAGAAGHRRPEQAPPGERLWTHPSSSPEAGAASTNACGPAPGVQAPREGRCSFRFRLQGCRD
jgi:hypothetical protein